MFILLSMRHPLYLLQEKDMATRVKEITLKDAFLKKINAKPGDHFEIIVKDNGKAVMKKKEEGIARKTFGIWKGEADGVVFMDRMRKRWGRR